MIMRNLFRNLPRHQFGNLQSKLFPAYFSLVTVSSAICLASFSFLCTWKPASPTERFQIFAISTTFVAGGLNLLILEPLTSSVSCLNFNNIFSDVIFLFT